MTRLRSPGTPHASEPADPASGDTEDGRPVTGHPLTLDETRLVAQRIERKAENITDRRRLVATVNDLRRQLDARAADLGRFTQSTVAKTKELERRALDAERQLDTAEDPFEWRGTWHVRHADGTTEDIVFEHGNLVEDSRGACGQFILDRRAAGSGAPTEE